ncbi:MAG: hypothetical protein AAF802_07930, partial [Planctomycetota bacterium]
MSAFCLLALLSYSNAFSDVPPIDVFDLEKELDAVAAIEGKEKLQAFANFLAGIGLEIRLIKGDRFVLPLKTMAVLRPGTVKLVAEDGSSLMLRGEEVAFLGYDGVWRKPKDGLTNRFRATLVLSEKFIFVTDLESGLMSR